MKKRCIVLTLVSLAALLLLTCVLPDRISVNGGIGQKMEISVYFILLLAPIPALCYWSHAKKSRRGKDE